MSSFLLKLTKNGQLICKKRFSSVAASSTTSKNEFIDPELKTAKPFESMPKQSLLTFEFLPGGPLFGKSFDQWHTHFQEKHGKIMRFKVGLGTMVIAYDPEDIKKVYQNVGPWPYRMSNGVPLYWREKRKDLFKNFKGLVMEQDENWQKYRTMINPIMMNPKTVSLYVPEVDEIAKDFVALTKKSLTANGETPADYGGYINRYALESIGTVALESRLNILEPQEGNKGTRLAKITEDLITLTFKLDMMPSPWRWITTPNLKKFIAASDEMIEIIQEYIDAAIVRLEKEGSSKPDELQGVLYKLLKIDKECAVIMAIDMMSVGIDTTASTLKNLFYLLAANPEKQAKLREEILEILPSKSDKLTAEKMKHMPYLRACMKESHRILAVVPGNARRVPYDIVLQGYRIPKGTDVILPHGILGVEEKHYAKASEFIPERWLKDESHAKAVGCPHSKSSHLFTYMPFGFGSRACIGKRFAELEVSILTTRLLREFEMSWNYPPPKSTSYFIKQIVSDMKIGMKEIQ